MFIAIQDTYMINVLQIVEVEPKPHYWEVKMVTGVTYTLEGEDINTLRDAIKKVNQAT